VTVAAVILSVAPGSALGDADGLARVRRLADVAWSGGAMPVIVVTPDPDGSVAVALAGAEVTLASPAPEESGPAAQMAHGVEIALGEVSETTAALLWPARLCWVGPETVTSLIEAHGATPDALAAPGPAPSRGWAPAGGTGPDARRCPVRPCRVRHPDPIDRARRSRHGHRRLDAPG
jgi:hypothetical protein